jgi:Family of unknown function (DUF6498)
VTSVETLGQAYDLYRRTATSRSAVLLLLANVIPLVGVVFFGWSLLTILVLYWLENGIVGLWNIPKIVMAQGSIVPQMPDLPASAALAATGSPAAAARLQEQWRAAQAAQAAQAATTASTSGSPAGTATGPTGVATSGLLGPRAAARLSAIPRTGLAMFFAFHYGMFWLVHGIFVFTLPAFAGGGFGGAPFGGSSGPGACFDPTGLPIECATTGPFGEVVLSSVVIGGIALFLSHGASFFLNYIGRGEYLTASPASQMGAVYGRVVVLHLTIIFGSMLVAFLGAPIGALLVLVVLKTAFDLGLHLRERRRAGPRVGGLAASMPPA